MAGSTGFRLDSGIRPVSIFLACQALEFAFFSARREEPPDFWLPETRGSVAPGRGCSSLSMTSGSPFFCGIPTGTISSRKIPAAHPCPSSVRGWRFPIRRSISQAMHEKHHKNDNFLENFVMF